MLPHSPDSRRTRTAALIAGALTFVASIVVASVALLQSSPPAPALAQPADPDRATVDVVVDFADGRVDVDRVGIAALPAPVTGMSVLEATRFDVARSGAAVCMIDGVGCPATDCFCGCREPEKSCAFWAYHHGLPDGGWRMAETGPVDHAARGGDVEGWMWGGDRAPITTTLPLRSGLVGLNWLRQHQTAAGGIADHVGFSSEAAFAARGLGVDSAGWRRDGGRSLAEFLAAEADDYSAGGAAQAGKALAGAVAAGLDPRAVGGVDLVARVMSRYDEATGRFGASTWDQSWSMIGLAAADGPPLLQARLSLDALEAASSPGGGWGFTFGAAEADADSTGLALQAMAGALRDQRSRSMVDGLAFLDRTQQGDGGWGHGGASNVNSTAYGLQGLLAMREDPFGDRWRAGSGASATASTHPPGFLMSTQRPDGRFGFDAFPSDLVATLQALPALAGRPVPIGGAPAAIARAVAWMHAHRTPEGGFEGESQPGATISAVLALAAAEYDVDAPAPSGATARAFLAASARDYAAKGPSSAGKLLVAIGALGANPRDFGGVDVTAALLSTLDEGTGRFGAGGIGEQAWAILGLAAARSSTAAGAPRIPPKAADVLIDAAVAGGGWGGDGAANVVSTGLVLQALGAAGVPATHGAVRAGIGYLWRVQRRNGGFVSTDFDLGSALFPTVSAIGGLAASGQAVDGTGWMRGPAGGLPRYSPRDAILDQQLARGDFWDDSEATYAAVLGLSGRPLPIRPAGAGVYLPWVGRDWVR